MKQLIENYTFDPMGKTITLLNMPNLTLEQFLLITNVNTNTIIYSFADPALGASSINNNVLTLDFDTSAMTATDRLQIFVDISNPLVNEGQLEDVFEQFTYDTNMEKVFGTQSLINNGSLKTNTLFLQNKVVGLIKNVGDAVGIDCEGFNTVAIQVPSNTAGSTLQFEGRVDAGNYASIQGVVLYAGVTSLAVSSANVGNTIIRINCAGLTRVQVKASSYANPPCTVTMIASSAKMDMNEITKLSGTSVISGSVSLTGTSQVYGSQSLVVQQKAGTGELNTYDTNLVGIPRVGFTAVDPVVAPTVNPVQPAAYADNKYAQFPQLQPRLRVETGGSQKLPFAQSTNGRTLVEYPEELSLLEQILIQLQLLNQNYALVNNVNLPNGTPEIK